VKTPEQQDVSVEMSRGVRVLFDTNALVSASLLPRSIPGQSFSHAQRVGSILTTPELAAELRDVLARPKFARYTSAEVRDEFLAAYLSEAEFVRVIEQVDVCRDPKDTHVLDAAINGQASYIISGDSDLLVLTPFRGIPILRRTEYPAQYRPTASR
jgi:putative PIN family toxin of toxin-antitoxin system